MDRCSHCGRQRAALKRCSVCKQAWYCGAECQNAAWKLHKRMCLKIDDVRDKVQAALAASDWPGVLKWEGRLDELLDGQLDEVCNWIILAFAQAHTDVDIGATSRENMIAASTLYERRIELLGKMQRFGDQGLVLCEFADNLIDDSSLQKEAARNYQRARDVGAAHGFFSVEALACLGLGRLAMQEGRAEEGLDLLRCRLSTLNSQPETLNSNPSSLIPEPYTLNSEPRNAMVAESLTERESQRDLQILPYLIDALIQRHKFDEVGPLIERLRDIGKTEGAELATMTERHIFYYRAFLHEVLCTFLLRWKPFCTARPLRPPRPNSVSRSQVPTRPRQDNRTP